jgi:hypothetical protein
VAAAARRDVLAAGRAQHLASGPGGAIARPKAARTGADSALWGSGIGTRAAQRPVFVPFCFGLAVAAFLMGMGEGSYFGSGSHWSGWGCCTAPPPRRFAPDGWMC